MNLKRWFPWLCLVLMLGAEILLLRSNSARDAALTDLHEARTRLTQAQSDLDDLKNANPGAQATEAANAAACIANLRLIDSAKQQWALDKNKDPNSVPTAQDLLPYFKDGSFPVCPDGGTYSLNSMAEAPACNITGHVVPAQ